MGNRNFSATSDDGGGIILSGGFWQAGAKITGRFSGKRLVTLPDQTESEVMTFTCVSPAKLKVKLDVNGKLSQTGKETEVDRFSIGNLTGIQMAIDGMRVSSGNRFKDFEIGDYVTFEMTGTKPATQRGFSDMLKFKLEVSDQPPF